MTNRIVDYIDLRHTSRNRVCEAVGIRQATLRRYIRGESEPPISVAYKMCDALKCNMEDLFPRDKEVQ